jgi:hypothetical protein
MDSDTESAERLDAELDHDTDAYWRRRVYVLAGGIAVIGLMAWACSSSGHKKSTAQVRNAAAMSPAVTAPTPPTASGGTSPVPTVTVTVTPTVTPAVPKRSGDRCDDGTVVVGLTPTSTVYSGKVHPRFGLSVVNTGRRTCTYDVGPKSLQVTIASGPDRVWSSARCAGGPGSNVQMLRRGVPYLATLDWNRKRCDGDSHAAAGTYVISARGAGIKTRREIFRLR